MPLPRDKAWFGPKRYGYGWGWPRCWQGWLAFGIYLLLFLFGFRYAPAHPRWFAAYAAILSAILVAICAWKGEAPKWRWGRTDDLNRDNERRKKYS